MMKHNLMGALALCCLIAFPQVTFCFAEPKEKNVHDRTQIVLKDYKFKAANFYEAANHAMSLGIQQDPSLKDVLIVIGPMAPRGKEKMEELDLKGDETLWNILRYWSEFYNLHMKMRKDTLVFDEIRSQP